MNQSNQQVEKVIYKSREKRDGGQSFLMTTKKRQSHGALHRQ